MSQTLKSKIIFRIEELKRQKESNRHNFYIERDVLQAKFDTEDKILEDNIFELEKILGKYQLKKTV